MNFLYPLGSLMVDAVIFSRDDLTLNGSGLLSITSPGGHGIVSKDSLRVTGGSYAMDISGHGLSGQDEVSIGIAHFIHHAYRVHIDAGDGGRQVGEP